MPDRIEAIHNLLANTARHVVYGPEPRSHG